MDCSNSPESMGRRLCLPRLLEWQGVVRSPIGLDDPEFGTVKLPVCRGHWFAQASTDADQKTCKCEVHWGTQSLVPKEMQGENHVANHAICTMLRFAVVQHLLSFQ